MNFRLPLPLLLLMLLLIALVPGCRTFERVEIGDTEAQLLAKRGQPTAVFQDGHSRLLEYRSGNCGQYTYMARVDSRGKVVSYDQVLTTQKFASIPVGKATKDDVLRTVGGPSQTEYLSRVRQEVWSYPYRESGAWNSIMHIHFDQSGVVQRLVNGQDLRFDSDTRFPFAAAGCF